MATILADDIFKCIFLNEMLEFLFELHWNLFPRILPALVRVMAWRRAGNKPLPEAMMTQFTDAYMHH